MKMRLLLLILASVALLSGCFSTAGYRGYGGGYYGSSSVDHRYGRSYPPGYYGGEYAYRYDRYGRPYVSYGYGYPYGYGYGSSYGSYGYGYPYGYYGGGHYYHPPQYHPGNGTGSNNPPPVMPPRTDLILRRRPAVSASPQMLPPPDQTLRDFSRNRRMQQAMPSPGYEPDQRIQPEQRMQPMPRMRQSAPDSSGESILATPNVSSDPMEEVRARKGESGR